MNQIAKELQSKLQNFNSDVNKVLESSSLKLIDKFSNHVTDEIYNKRYSICQSCDKFNKEVRKCILCNCWMTAKCKISKAKCPDNPSKW